MSATFYANLFFPRIFFTVQCKNIHIWQLTGFTHRQNVHGIKKSAQKAILVEAGMDFTNVIKCSIFISDMNNFSKINAVYGEYFNEATAPARETVEVANLPKYVNIEISAIAVK